MQMGWIRLFRFRPVTQLNPCLFTCEDLQEPLFEQSVERAKRSKGCGPNPKPTREQGGGVVLVLSDALESSRKRRMLTRVRMQVSGREQRPGTPTLSVTLPPPCGRRFSLARSQRTAAGPQSSRILLPSRSQRPRWALTPLCRRKRSLRGQREQVGGGKKKGVSGTDWEFRADKDQEASCPHELNFTG